MAIQIRARAVRNGLPIGDYQIIDGANVTNMPAGTHPRAYTNSRMIMALGNVAVPPSSVKPVQQVLNSSSKLSLADHARALAYRAAASKVGCTACQKARSKIAAGVIKALNAVSTPKT